MSLSTEFLDLFYPFPDTSCQGLSLSSPAGGEARGGGGPGSPVVAPGLLHHHVVPAPVVPHLPGHPGGHLPGDQPRLHLRLRAGHGGRQVDRQLPAGEGALQRDAAVL